MTVRDPLTGQVTVHLQRARIVGKSKTELPVNRGLFETGHDPNQPRWLIHPRDECHAVLESRQIHDEPGGREGSLGTVKHVESQPGLLEVVLTLRTPGCGLRLLNRREQPGDQDGNHNQQLDECESRSVMNPL